MQGTVTEDADFRLLRVFKPLVSDVPFPLDVVFVREATTSSGGGQHWGRLLVAGQEGVHVLTLTAPQGNQTATTKPEVVTVSENTTNATGGWNFDVVHDPIKGSDGSQLVLGSVEISSQLPAEKQNVITKLVPLSNQPKVACLFASNKGNIGGLAIHKGTPRIFFRLSLTDCAITCSHLTKNGKTLLCGTSSATAPTWPAC